MLNSKPVWIFKEW